ncbi:DNA internalization-related competence protein ComEC/Rec2 [Cohnella faecalis]|uniref:DNA internalization-related competence protein ComEC/Rec2 n=1 Tax=Cohnella faecalis TaxID=2315694 RepID=A0A398CWG5_9BACL|nr:DNA internalization-related competence protein ComEC/Rec2 [Cohnella faecalis]RIE04167.1 DNA internalization-related competence protein ComEC/Rec2 [Cohnella faecalis]
MGRRPLVLFAVCWLVGASAPSLLSFAGSLAALAGAAFLLIGTTAFRRISGKLALLCAAALFLSFGHRMWAEQGNQTKLSPDASDAARTEAVLTGRLLSPASVDGDLVVFRIAANVADLGLTGEWTNVAGERLAVRVKLKERTEQAAAKKWKRGMTVRIGGVLERPGSAGNFGTFDYRAYLERQQVHWQLTAEGAASVIITKRKPPLFVRPMQWIDFLREAIGERMNRLFPNGDAGYMKGLVAGIQEDIDPGQYDGFSRLGLTHVLAISGLHVGVVVFALLRFGAVLRLTRERGMELTIAAMPVYMLLTGASASAVRACLMAMIALALARRNQLKDGLHLLAAAALIMVVGKPAIVEEVSFQLSFAVTAGLLLFVPLVAAWLPIRWKPLRNALAVAITAQAASFPLSAYYFHGLHLLSLPANLILVPFISFIVMPLGLAAILLGSLWLPLGIVPAKIATVCNEMTFRIVGQFDNATRLQTVWPQSNWHWVVAAYLLMGLTALWLRRLLEARQWAEQEAAFEAEETVPLREAGLEEFGVGKPFAVAGMLLLSAWGGWLLWGIKPAFLDLTAKAMFLDVGQGDSILIRTGGGRYALIDTGGAVSFRKPGDEWRERRDPYEVGRKLLVPLLKQRGVRVLEALVLTHLDQDHIGGAEAVIRNVPVRRIVFNGTIKDASSVRKLFRLALDKGIPLFAARAGTTWRIDGSASIDVLYPERHPGDAVSFEDEQNDRSVVLKLALYGRTFMLPGDLEAAGERNIATAYAADRSRPSPEPVDVLKAGHHGSKTSTVAEWLELWTPREAVISVGRNNLYGHPHLTVLNRLDEYGVAYFRTDRDGEIQYRISPSGKLERREKRAAEEVPSTF